MLRLELDITLESETLVLLWGTESVELTVELAKTHKTKTKTGLNWLWLGGSELLSSTGLLGSIEMTSLSRVELASGTKSALRGFATLSTSKGESLAQVSVRLFSSSRCTFRSS